MQMQIASTNSTVFPRCATDRHSLPTVSRFVSRHLGMTATVTATATTMALHEALVACRVYFVKNQVCGCLTRMTHADVHGQGVGPDRFPRVAAGVIGGMAERGEGNRNRQAFPTASAFEILRCATKSRRRIRASASTVSRTHALPSWLCFPCCERVRAASAALFSQVSCPQGLFSCRGPLPFCLSGI